MPLDPSIMMGAKPVDIQNPMDAMSKVMSFQQLGLQAKQANQAYNDEQAMRNAYSQNTTVGPDGKMSFNKEGMLADLGKSNPYLVPKAQMALAQNDQEMMKIKGEQAGFAGQMLNGVKDQEGWDKAKQHLASIGYPVNQLPDQYDPKTVDLLGAQAMSHKDYYDQQQKDRQMGIDQQKFNYEQGKGTVNSVQTALDKFRSEPAAIKANEDLKNVADFKGIVNSAVNPKTGKVDPNLLTADSVKRAMAAIDKISGSITEPTGKQKLAELQSRITNSPTPAGQAKAIKEAQDYADTIAGNAHELLGARAKNILDEQKQYLNGVPGAYNQFYKDAVAPHMNQGPAIDMAKGKNKPPLPGGGTMIAGNANHPALKGKSLAELKKMAAEMGQANADQ